MEAQKELKGQNVDNKTDKNKNVNVIDDDSLIFFYCENDYLMTNCDIRWVVDSCTSFHATPNRIFFTTYEACDSGVVKMGSNDTSEIIGQRDVQVATNMSYKLTLTNIWHIPDSRMNLMSTGVLDDEGFNSHFVQSAWKLVKGSLIVAKGKKYCSLYDTNANLVQREVIISSNDSTMR